MNPDITKIIVGPPGTGKTTTLLTIAEGMMESGYRPNEICFVTFTRKGAHEAKARAMTKFNLQEQDLPWWKTLHSLAFSQLGLSRSQIMGFGDYTQLCGQLGLSITNKGMSEDGNISGLSKGDRLFFMENMARAKMVPLKQYWEDNYMEDVMWYELERLSNTMLAYKAAQGKQDFTDIIYSFNSLPNVPQIKTIIIDEAQDLTPLQWNMVKHLAKDVEQIYIAGDDDQAIFKWAGADVDYFMAIQGQRSVLPRSYRVPIAVQNVAETIAKRIETRIPKTWEPTKEQGIVEYVTDLGQIDMSQGQWLLLGRNLFALEAYNRHCLDMGYVFSSHIGSPISSETLPAIIHWEDLRKGKSIMAKFIKPIYDLMSAREKIRHGSKTQLEKVSDETILNMAQLIQDYGLLTDEIWHLAMDRIPVHEREYFISALRRGEKLMKEPRIKINTIHSVKGGESDNVVILPDMASRTWKEYQTNPDDEHRVWYVAVTRTKKALYILTPKTDKAYEI